MVTFATTQMDFEDITLNEKSQTETNAVWSHLNVESKGAKLIEAETRRAVTRDEGNAEILVKGRNFQ